MTSQEIPFLYSNHGPYMSSRAHIGLTQLDSDLKHPDRAPAILTALRSPKANNTFDFIDDFLIPSNTAGWENMANNKFCQEMAKTKKGDVSMLGHFKWYMLQDMLYLKNYVYWKLGFFSTAPWDDVASAADSIGGSVNFVTSMTNNTLIAQLGIPAEAIKAATPIAELKQYCDYLIESSKKDDWFSVHVAVVPCLVGYEKIANRLYQDPTIDKESTFYKLWIEPNHGEKSTKKYKDFLNKYYDQYKTPELEAHWKDLFKKSCAFELAFWDVSLNHTL